MMILLGTSAAVPLLLLLNTVVSAVATARQVLKTDRQTVRKAITGFPVGGVAGRSVYPWLSEAIVLTLTASLLLIGLLTTLLPLRRAVGTAGFSTIFGLSGLATVWAATPGPLMVFGLIAKGRQAKDVAKLVQPIALVAYGIAFLLHSLSAPQAFTYGPQIWGFVALTLIASLRGRIVGPYLPQTLVTAAIRVVSLLACGVLFLRAFTIA